MLHFFRKHQKFLFIFVTIIIVFSFVFFGTYQAFRPGLTATDEVLFKAIDGTKIKKSYFTAFCHFLEEEATFPTSRNFLNDGVISRAILETKAATFLFEKDSQSFGADLEQRRLKEMAYAPYTHPSASFISADAIWSIFAPDVKENLEALKRLGKGKPRELFETKVALFLSEKRFPPAFLSQVLRYQEQQYAAASPDYRLQQDATALFGYKTLSDWFGENFVNQAAVLILNGAALARTEGLKVTREEVIADLALKNEKLFQSMKEELPAHIATPAALFRFYLMQQGLDESTLVTLWQDILLFRRLMDEKKSIACGDNFALKEFYAVAGEEVVLERYEMAPEFQFKNEEELKRFENYMSLVGKQGRSLDVFEAAEIAEIEKRAPELVASRFVVDIVELSKEELQGKVSVRESWEWEEKNWDAVAAHFPQFNLKTSQDLAALDSKGRNLVDGFARSKIVDTHPEWLAEAFQAKQSEQKELFLKGKETTAPLVGISDPASFKALLEKEEKLEAYTQDGLHFYTIVVKERKPKEIVLFKNAALESSSYNVSEVLTALYQDLKARQLLTTEIDAAKLGETISSYRFVPYLSKKPEMAASDAFSKQFALVKKQEVIARGKPGSFTLEELQNRKEKEVSDVVLGQKGTCFFYTIVERRQETTLPQGKIARAQEMMGADVALQVVQTLLTLMDEKQACLKS